MACKHYRYQHEVVRLVGGCELEIFFGFDCYRLEDVDVIWCFKFEKKEYQKPEEGSFLLDSEMV